MSNIFLTQRLRHKHGVSWEEEFILGMVAYNQTLRVMDVIAGSGEVMTQATSHKYLTQLIDKGLLAHHIVVDKRIKMLKLTAKGEKYLKEIENVRAVPSVAVS